MHSMKPHEIEEARRVAAAAARAEQRAALRAKQRGETPNATETQIGSGTSGRATGGVQSARAQVFGGIGGFGTAVDAGTGGGGGASQGRASGTLRGRLLQTAGVAPSAAHGRVNGFDAKHGHSSARGTGLYLDALSSDQRARELAVARERYLGRRAGFEQKEAETALAEGGRKRRRAGRDKSSLRFEWDEDDDTSKQAGGAALAVVREATSSAEWSMRGGRAGGAGGREQDRWGMRGGRVGDRNEARGGSWGRDWDRGGRQPDGRGNNQGGGWGRDGRDRGGQRDSSSSSSSTLPTGLGLFGRGSVGGMAPEWAEQQSHNAMHLLEMKRKKCIDADKAAVAEWEKKKKLKDEETEREDAIRRQAAAAAAEGEEEEGEDVKRLRARAIGGTGDAGSARSQLQNQSIGVGSAAASRPGPGHRHGQAANIDRASTALASRSEGETDAAADAGRGSKIGGDQEAVEDEDEDADEDMSMPMPAMGQQATRKRRRRTTDTRHWSEKDKVDMTTRDWRIMREDFDIRVRGAGGLGVPLPLRVWPEANLHEGISRAIRDKGYEQPSAIQRQAIPIGLEGRDLVGVAETGSGKTAAFVIPMLQRLMKAPPGVREACATDGPLALILAPVRELAQQIFEEAQTLARHVGLRAACVVGGIDIHEQASILSKGVEVVVAAPGRLIECVNKSYLVFNQCRYIVLDEADRMIDLGFGPEVEQIMEMMAGDGKDDSGGGAEGSKGESAATVGSQAMVGAGKGNSSAGKRSSGDGEAIPDWMRIPPHLRRTTIMFSATMPQAVEKLARSYMRHPVTVRIGDHDSGKNQRIKQTVMKVPFSRRQSKLAEALRSCPRPVIVFVNMKKTADLLTRDIEGHGHAVVCLHGGKTQVERELSLAAFKSGDADVMVATDVAARGLDIPGVMHVINHELPKQFDSYTHRIGRTARAGAEGSALSFWSEDDSEVLPQLKAHLEGTGQKVPPDLERAAAVDKGAGQGAGKKLR